MLGPHPSREKLIYLVWGMDIKTKLMVQGGAGGPRGTPVLPLCHQPEGKSAESGWLWREGLAVG